jgi:LysM repeat protein
MTEESASPSPTADASSAPKGPGAASSPVVEPAAPALVAVGACPFLIAAAGAYRMNVPDREHRCAAFVPATSLAVTKQARLCLTANHVGCATFIASTSAREARVGTGERIERAGRWGLARTMPVVEEVGGLRATLGALIGDRRTWPAIPAVLLATLLLALGLSGSWGEHPTTAVASPTPSPRRDVSPAPTTAIPPTLGVSPSILEASPTPAATAAPSPTTVPSATPAVTYITYRIKNGDTLSGIASRFHTTVKAITALNGITASTTLHVGQVLKIPRT